jgi:hypothetical protein
MKTLDIEIAIIKGFNPRQNIIVPNVSWGLHDNNYAPLHECDVLILSGSNYATEVEIKVSKSDLLIDKNKRHAHKHNLIRRFYYAVPEKLKDTALEIIPENAGLLVISTKEATNYKWYDEGRCDEYKIYYNRVDTVKECKINTSAIKWTDEQKFQLARLGAMRILGLKQKVQKLMSKPAKD